MHYLKWDFGIKLEFWDFLRPWHEFLRFGVDEVIKNSSSRWKLNSFELCRPPLGELHPVINQLQRRKNGIRESVICGANNWIGHLLLSIKPKSSILVGCSTWDVVKNYNPKRGLFQKEYILWCNALTSFLTPTLREDNCFSICKISQIR